MNLISKVIHFRGEPIGPNFSLPYLARRTNQDEIRIRERPKVEITTLDRFLRGGQLRKQLYGDGIGSIHINPSPPDLVIKRAKILLENRDNIDYHLFLNNCEHLAIWCKTGKKFSLQGKMKINFC